MTTRRERVLAAVATALAGTTGVSTRIYRSRVEPISRAESPAIVIEPISDNAAQNTSLPTLDWSMVVRISVIVRGAVPDQLADPIIESLHAKLMADLTLGGYAIDVQPIGVTFNFTEADGAAGEIQCDYRVQYRTAVANLASV
jgi:hypothetical protein